MDDDVGQNGPYQPGKGQVNGSRWHGSGARDGQLDGWASWYDLGAANGHQAGKPLGVEASSPVRADVWTYTQPRVGEIQAPSGHGIRADGSRPRDPLPLHGRSPAPRATGPPAGLNGYSPVGYGSPGDIATPGSVARDALRGHYGQPYPPVNGRSGQAVDRRQPYAVARDGPGRAVDGPHSTLAWEPQAGAVMYPRTRQDVQVPPPGPPPMLVAPGTGPKLGVRAAVVTLVAIVVLAAIVYGVYAITQTPPLTNLSAQVVSTGQVALGFPQAGVLTGVLVRPGEHVATGQMLATEMVAGLNQQVTADNEAVHTDQLDIRQLNTLLNAADQQAAASTASQRQVAVAGVSSAAAAIGSTVPARQEAISAFQAEVNIANQTLQADESTYARTCGSSPTGGASCESLAHQVAADRLSLASAQANLSAQQAAQADWQAEANRLLAEQQAAQAGLSGNTTLALAPLEVDLANAKGQLMKDQAQLATDQAKKAGGNLQAPQAGTVVSVDGAPGEVVSGAGVAGANSTGGSVTVTPGFELFPAHQSSAGSQASTQPVVVLDVGGPLVVNVVVPESQIGLVHVGAPVKITPGIAGPDPTPGVVSEIFPSSIVAGGVVSYEVQVKGSSPASTRGWLPGMTATATIGR